LASLEPSSSDLPLNSQRLDIRNIVAQARWGNTQIGCNLGNLVDTDATITADHLRHPAAVIAMTEMPGQPGSRQPWVCR
jgi:hypothetical protein